MARHKLTRRSVYDRRMPNRDTGRPSGSMTVNVISDIQGLRRNGLLMTNAGEPILDINGLILYETEG